MSNEITGYTQKDQNLYPSMPLEGLAEMEAAFWTAFPDGRLATKAVVLNDKLAIIESRVYFDKRDGEEGYAANRIGFATRRDGDLNGEYIKSAEKSGLIQALTETDAVWRDPPKKERLKASGKPGRKPAANAGTAKDLSEKTVPEENPSVVLEPVEETMPESVQSAMPGPIGGESPAPVSPLPTAQPVPEPASRPVEAEAKVIPMPDSSSPTLEELLTSMTVEGAVATVIDFGTDKGKTVGQLARMDPEKLEWLRDSYKGPNNQVKAAATLLLLQAGDVPA